MRLVLVLNMLSSLNKDIIIIIIIIHTQKAGFLMTRLICVFLDIDCASFVTMRLKS